MADKKSEDRMTDLHKTGRVNTTVETQTKVVDNTEAAPERDPVEYELHISDLGDGTVLHTMGEPKGGFPKADSEDA